MRDHGMPAAGAGGWEPKGSLEGGLTETPDLLLPEQFFPGRLDLGALQPEQRLMLAVLEDAVCTFQKNVRATRGEGRKRFQEVEAWFASDETQWLFAFQNLCDALGVNAAVLRSALRRWRAAQQQRADAGLGFAPVRLRRFTGGRPRVVGGRSLLRDLH